MDAQNEGNFGMIVENQPFSEIWLAGALYLHRLLLAEGSGYKSRQISFGQTTIFPTATAMGKIHNSIALSDLFSHESYLCVCFGKTKTAFRSRSECSMKHNKHSCMKCTVRFQLSGIVWDPISFSGVKLNTLFISVFSSASCCHMLKHCLLMKNSFSTSSVFYSQHQTNCYLVWGS